MTPEAEAPAKPMVWPIICSLVVNSVLLAEFYRAHRYLFTNPMGIEGEDCVNLLMSNYELSKYAYMVAAVGIAKDVLQLFTSLACESNRCLTCI